MIEPIAAEFAQPPIFTNADERTLRDEPVEHPHLHDHRGSASGALASAKQGQHGHSNFNNVEAGTAGEKSTNPYLVRFEPGTGEDPREWSKAKKWAVTVTASMLCLSVALGSSLPTGDFRGPAEELGVSNEVIFLSISLFVVGFGVGPLLFAPLSEVVGRRVVYSISMFFFFMFTLPSALAQNIGTMLVGRALAGIASSAPMTNVGGTIADIWAVEERGIPMALFSSTVFMGPCLGPLFGGWISYKTGQWRWIYWVLFILCGVTFAAAAVCPETLAPVILKRKAAKLRKSTGNDAYKSQSEIDAIPLGQRLKIAIARPLIMMFAEPIILFISFYLSFVYALLYLLFFAFPIAFEEVRGWNPGMTGTAFVSIIVGILLAGCVLPLQEKAYHRATVNGAYPEARLYPMMVGSVVLPIALFIFAFTGGYAWVHWMGVMVAGSLFGFAMITIYVSANSYIVDSYASFAASAIAAKTLMRSEVGASVPLWVTQLFHNLGFQYAGLFLALISCLILPIPFLFFRYGKQARLRSKRAEVE